MDELKVIGFWKNPWITYALTSLDLNYGVYVYSTLHSHVFRDDKGEEHLINKDICVMYDEDDVPSMPTILDDINSKTV